MINSLDFNSKWLVFIDHTEFNKKTEHAPKTGTYVVRNKENVVCLGVIKWYGPFRKYSFFPEGGMVFEQTCLEDITRFLKEVEADRKAQKRKGV